MQPPSSSNAGEGDPQLRSNAEDTRAADTKQCEPPKDHEDVDQADKHGWELVEKATTENTEKDTGPERYRLTSTNSNFNITLGLGKWKHQLLSYKKSSTRLEHDDSSEAQDDTPEVEKAGDKTR